ncbi:Transcription initiation factor TFIID subunit 6 [Asimina triloba]
MFDEWQVVVRDNRKLPRLMCILYEFLVTSFPFIGAKYEINCYIVQKNMSIVPKETIEVIAQSIGINNLSQDVALALAPDVEFRVRQIMQTDISAHSLTDISAEAIKCMCHSKRTVLTADDVDSALSLRNVEKGEDSNLKLRIGENSDEVQDSIVIPFRGSDQWWPIYGFASGDPLRFKRAVDHKDLFYIDDKDVEFRDLIEAPLPKAPLDTAIVVHWLAIEGVQPAIPENAPVEAPVAPPDDKKSDHSKEDGLPVDVKLPVKHVLSRELQMVMLYFDKFTELIVSKSDSNLFKEALRGLARDSGLHPLVPYFTHFIADEVSQSLNDLPVLFALMRVVRTLLQNPHIHIEPYLYIHSQKLHQLMPSVITCIVAKRLGHRLTSVLNLSCTSVLERTSTLRHSVVLSFKPKCKRGGKSEIGDKGIKEEMVSTG